MHGEKTETRDPRARKLIFLLAVAWLSVTTSTSGARLIDVAFTGGSTTTQIGFAAFGISSNDFWNTYSNAELANLAYADETPSGALLSLSPWEGVYGYPGPDAMMSTYLYQTNSLIVTITNLRAGPYNVFLYGHGNLDAQGAAFEVSVGGVSYGSRTTGAPGWDTANWAEGSQYVEFTNVNVATGKAFQILVTPVPGYTYADLSGLQIVSTGDPVLISGPSNVVVAAGATTTLQVIADGPGPLTYQWQRNSNNIPGATNSILVLTNVQVSQTGFYGAIVENAYGSSTTPGAFVEVLPSANRLIDVAFTGGPTTIQKGFAAMGKSSSDFWNTYGNTSALTALAYTDGSLSGATLRLSDWSGVYGDSAVDPMLSTFLYEANGPMTLTVSNLPPGLYEFFVYGHGNYDAENAVFHLFAGGLDYGSAATPADSSWVSSAWVDGEQYVSFTNVVVGSGQTVTIVVAEGASAYSVLCGLQIGYESPLPAQPQVAPATLNEYVLQGSNTTVSVGAFGTPPLAYAWRLNNVNLPATNSSYDITSAQPQDSGLYNVTVTNAFGSATSAPIALNVIAPPRSLINVAFIGGGAPIKSGYAATGINSNDLWNADTAAPVPNLVLADGTVTGTGLSWVTNAANTLFADVSDAMEQLVLCSGEGGLSFAVTNLITGTYDFYLYGHGPSDDQNSSFQLKVGSKVYGPKSNLNGPGWHSAFWQAGVQYARFADVSVGAGETVYVLVAPNATTNAFLCGLQIAGLTPWLSLPFFLSEPVSQTMNPGAPTVFAAKASGTAPLTYQWYFDGAVIPGATNASLILSNLLSGDGTYTVLASNAVGATMSSAATLTSPAPTFGTQAPDEDLYQVTLRAILVPSNSPTAVWFEWGGDTNYGQVTPPVEIGAQAIVVSNTINGLTPYTTYHYQAVASNSAGVFYGGDVAFTTVPRFAQMGTNGDWGSFVLSRDGRTVVAERNNVMYVSTNLGATFTATAGPGIAFATSTDGSRILSSAGKITYVSEDYGQTWRTNPSAPLSLGNLAVTANADTIFSNDGGLGFEVSTNSGLTWRESESPNPIYLACTADGSKLYGSGGRIGPMTFPGWIYGSSSFGASWTALQSVNGTFGGAACSANGSVAAVLEVWYETGPWVSTNGFVSFSSQTYLEEAKRLDISADGSTILAGMPITVSPNSGASWFQANVGYLDGPVHTSADGNVLAIFNGAIYLSVPSVNSAVQVNIEPSGAVVAGAQWELNGLIKESSGVLVPNLRPATGVMSFTPVLGWAAPSNISVNLVAGQTNIVTATYVQQFGSLQVDLSPPGAVGAGARWQLDGGTPQNSDAVVQAGVGYHALNFLPASGWAAPEGFNVYVPNGATNYFHGIYTPSTSVQVLLGPPAAAAAGAKWQLDSGGFEKSGTVLSGVPLGSHSITFESISGWDTPASFDFMVTNGQSSVFTANYQEQFGALQVNIAPTGAVTAGAAWQLDDGAYYGSGTLLDVVGVGPHKLHFLTVSGWATPRDEMVSVSKGATNVVTQIYLPAGSLQVNLAPTAAAQAGAGWRVDGGALQNAGAIVRNLSVGNHTVSFSFARGWTTPPNQIVDIASNATTTLVGTYPPAAIVTNSDQVSLRDAMASGGTVDLAVNGTILLTNAIVVSNDVVLDGTGYNAVLSGGSNTQIFVIETNATLVLNNLTVANGFDVGPYLNFTFAPGTGGAISNAGSLIVISCQFSNNTTMGAAPSFRATGAYGGAIFNLGSLVVTNSAFSQNQAFGAGDSEFGQPGGEANGGAIYNAGHALIVQCVFAKDASVGGAGSLGQSRNGTDGGAAMGGGLCNAGTLTLIASILSGNSAAGGAGGTGAPGQPNYGFGPGYPGGNGGAPGDGDGGGLCSLSGNLTIVNSTFVSNSAAGGAGGGGGDGGSISVGRGQASNGGNGANGANGIGGAVCVIGGAASITNVSCAGNASASGSAGGAGAAGSGGVGGVGGYPGFPGGPGLAVGASIAGTNGGALAVANSILDCAGKQTNAYGTIIDGGYNLNSDASGFFTNSTSLNGVDPMLGALGNYGGPTETIPLLPGSPAINAGDPVAFPATDQRGFARPSGAGPDIGAFEYTFVNLAALALTNGAVKFDLQGEWSNTVVIEVSSDLEHWAALGTNMVSSNGVNTISDPNASSGARFYRAVKE